MIYLTYNAAATALCKTYRVSRRQARSLMRSIVSGIADRNQLVRIDGYDSVLTAEITGEKIRWCAVSLETWN